MKSEIKKGEKSTCTLTVKIEEAEIKEAHEKAVVSAIKTVSVPGFRKGKAPFNIVERYYGDSIFYEDAFNELVPDVYDKEIKDNKIDVVSKPHIDIVQMEKGKDLIFTAIVNTKPEVKLGKYKGIELKKVEYKVTDEDVEHELSHMAEHNSRLVSVDDRPAKKDDTVTIDFEGFVDGKPFDGGKAEGQQLTIGSNTFIPGFEDQLIGMKIDEERDIKVKFPDDYFSKDLAGKDATFHIKLHSISYKELPKIDDEFAKDVSEFDTLADLKKDIKSKQEKQNADRAKNEMEEKAIEEVSKNTKIDIPDGMIELEIDNMENDIAQRLQYQGLSLEQYLKMLNKTESDLRNEFKDDAKKNITTRLVLEQIVADENIKADQKFIDEELEKMEKQYGRKADELKKNEEVMNYLDKSSKNEQAVKFIIDNAKITK